MPPSRLALPPRNLVALIAGIALVPLAFLSWMGARVLDQDRILEAQQRDQRLALAADRVVTALQRPIDGAAQLLIEGRADRTWPTGAVAAEFSAVGAARLLSPGRAAWLPAVAVLPEAASSVFVDGETSEFRRNDGAGAIRAYQALAASPDRAIRAGALLRLARTLRAAGDLNRALDAYARAASYDDVGFGGVPAGLAARYARLSVLDAQHRASERATEARALGADLAAGRWPLTCAVYELYASDVERWGGAKSGTGRDAEVLAAAIDRIWNRRSSLVEPGQALLAGADVPLLALWRPAGGALRVLIVTGGFVDAQWMRGAAAAAGEQGVIFELRARDGAHVAGARVTVAAGAAGAGDGNPSALVRRAGETGLPWDVAVAPAAGTGLAGSVGASSAAGVTNAFAQRRRLLLAGFAVVVVLSLAASVLILRAVSREVAVARLKSDFVAAVSHEFRTPLTSLRQFTDMLRSDPEPGPERRRLCYDAQSRAADRLTRLVESLLDFGRMEAGARRYRFERLDGAALAERVVDEFRRDAGPAGFTIAFAADGPAAVDADQEALSRAIWNLLDNAVKYSPAARTVDVRAERRGLRWAVAVADRGIGIPVSEREAVLSAFHRGEEATRRGIRGTGIGLAMVNQIVLAHHGDLTIDSEPGAGSTFTIVLPLAE